MRRVTMTDFSKSRCFGLVFCVLCLDGTFVATAPILRCPNYVDEGEDFACDCLAPRSTGVMPGVATWPGRSNTSRLTLHAVSRRDNGTKLTCQLVMMSQLSTKEYTLQVAYGPTDSTVHIEGPRIFVTNGSIVLNLACQATEVNPSPTITWQFEPCNHGTPRVNCSFTPKPLEHDNQTISCRASNLVTRVVSSGYANYTLRLQYPPSDPPSIRGHIDGQIHKPGDKLTCTVTGGKPPVSRVIFNCTNPYHKDQEDVITTDKRSSPLDVKSSERQDFETVCTCQAIWEQQPSLYFLKTSISFAISAEFSQEYVTSRCVTSEAYIKESASVTCYFSANLQKSGKSFQLYRNDIDSGNAWSQQQNKYEMVLDCYWLNDGELQCAPMPPGYEFNGLATDKLTVTIPKVSLDFLGRYGCRAQPSHPQEIQHCLVVPKERPETTITVPAGKKKVADDAVKEGSSNVSGIVTGVLMAVAVAVVVAALIVLFVLRRRVLLWIRRFRRKPRTREENLGETGRRLLPSGPSPAINESITQQPSGSSAVTDERIDNLETVVLKDSGEGADDRNDDTHVEARTTREEPPSTSDTGTRVNKNYRATVGPEQGAVGPRTAVCGPTTADLGPMAFTHDPESKPVQNAHNNNNDEMQQGAEALPLSENNKDKKHGTSAELHEDTTPSTTNNAELMPSPEERGATGVSEASRRHPAEEGKAAAANASDHTQDKDNPKKPPSDIVRLVDMEGVPNLNWKFYQNEIASRPNGRRIEEIHERWARDFDLLDRHHNYIQWLFPIPEKPARNPMAQELFDYEAEAIRSDAKSSACFLTSFKIMLNYFGLQLEPTGDVSRSDKWNDRCKTLQNNSANYYRISRILTCLGEMGCEHLKKPFIQQILLEVSSNPNLKAALKSCWDYWIPTVKDEKERKELKDWYNIASGL